MMALPLAAAPKSVEIAYGKSARACGLTITFAELIQESRCPKTVTCVWAGVGEIRIVVKKGRKSESLKISTREAQAKAFGHTLTLASLDPYPEEPGTRDPKEYRATITVE